MEKKQKAILCETYITPVKNHKLKLDTKNFEEFKEIIKKECKLDDIKNYILIEKSIEREIEDQEDFELMLRDLKGEKPIEINIVKKVK